MLSRPSTHYAETEDGLSIAYQAFGSGPRDIVLIPTGHCIDLIWDEPGFVDVLERLARLGRVVVIDYRGFGAADPVPLGALPTPESWMEDTRVVLDALGWEQVHIVCHGGAGFVGMLFAAMYPDRTESLTLLEATARISQAEDYPIGVPDAVLEEFIAENVRRWGTPSSAEMFTPSRAGDPRFCEWLARFERGAMSKATYAAVFRWLAGLDLRSVLPTIRAPTLIVNREHDFMSPQASAHFLADHISNSTLAIVPGTDYWFFSEGSDTIFDKVEEFVTGAPPVDTSDRALATVMFTDIVGSTAHATRLGDHQWAQVLDRHDSLVARELDRFRGRKVNPTGDGILATFDGPARAVRCALSICESVRALGVEVRAGLHVGEVEIRGDDIGGIAVHIGQRISSLAGPGEVLVSRTVTDLVAGSEIAFDDRGDHELKGVPGAWRVFAVQG